MADSTINIFGSSGEAMVGADTINTILASMDSKLTSDDINIETLGDGTVNVDVKNDTYTINLNHTHEGMAKLVKCTEATLPQTMEDDTIYVQVDNATTPTEIEALHIFGLEFTGGGLPAGTPQITSPKSTIPFNLGTAYGQGGAKGTVQVKGKNLTANSSLTVSVGSGFSLSYGQQSGSSITIDAAAATIGADVDVFATSYGTSGTLLITSQTDNISVEVDLTSDVFEDLAAVKLTGTQWLQTDYYPNPNTEFELTCRFEANSHTNQSGANNSILRCLYDANTSDERFAIYTGTTGEYNYSAYRIYKVNKRADGPSILAYDNAQKYSSMTIDNAVLRYTKDSSKGTFSFTAGGSTESVQTPLQTWTMLEPMQIGHRPDTNAIYNAFNLTIYALTITENGTTKRHYVPKLKNGTIPGLYDIENDKFISSMVEGQELVAIQ